MSQGHGASGWQHWPTDPRLGGSSISGKEPGPADWSQASQGTAESSQQGAWNLYVTPGSSQQASQSQSQFFPSSHEQLNQQQEQTYAAPPYSPAPATMNDDDRISRIESLFNHQFQVITRPMALQAIRHASYYGGQSGNKGLAMIGESAMRLAIVEIMALKHANQTGLVTVNLSQTLNNAHLAGIGRRLELDKLIQVGPGYQGKAVDSMIMTTLEAIIGVIYWDRGTAGVRETMEMLEIWKNPL